MVYNDKASKVQRALIFQGGGSLRAYEAGAYKAINDELSAFIRKRQGREKKEPKFDKRIASGESARRYYSTKEIIFKGVPNVFRPKNQNQTIDFLIHQIHGIFMTINH